MAFTVPNALAVGSFTQRPGEATRLTRSDRSPPVAKAHVADPAPSEVRCDRHVDGNQERGAALRAGLNDLARVYGVTPLGV